MRCLVTGGAGFIGSHLVRGLLHEGHDVRVLDNYSTGKRENIGSLSIEMIEGDVRDYSTVQAAVSGMDYVFRSEERRGGEECS